MSYSTPWALVRVGPTESAAEVANDCIDRRFEMEEGSGLRDVKPGEVISYRRETDAFLAQLSELRREQIAYITDEFRDLREGLAKDGKDYSRYTLADLERDILAGYPAGSGGTGWLWCLYRVANAVYHTLNATTVFLDCTADLTDDPVPRPALPDPANLPPLDPDEDLALVMLWAKE